MKLTLALAFVAFSVQSFAIPSTDLLKAQIEKRMQSFRSAPHTGNGCVNFSGTWKGKCSVDDKSEDVTAIISQQGCESITVDGTTTAINSLLGMHLSGVSKEGVAYAVSFDAVTEWNKEQTQLDTIFTGIVKPLQAAGTLPIVGSASVKFDGAKLTSTVDFFGKKIACVYDKQ